MKCRRCDFESTVSEVDNHFIHRIGIGDPDHAYMSGFPFPPDRPLDDFIDLLSEASWGKCLHIQANTELVRLSKPGLGYATYCRDCHTCVDYPLGPGCTCDRRGPGRWAGHHQTTCGYHKAWRKCRTGCDFEGTPEEVEEHRDSIIRAAHWTDRESVALARFHGFITTEPCEECGNMISSGRDAVSSNHTWACSLHPSNVVRPPGAEFVEVGLLVGGGMTLKVDGVEQDVCAITAEINQRAERWATERWGACECDDVGIGITTALGPHHQANCPRYREGPNRYEVE